MNIDPEINVWTLSPRGKWKLELTTTDIQEAGLLAVQLDKQGKGVAMYELGAFEHEGRQVVGQVGFIWSESLDEYMERSAEGRGVGWSDVFGTWVEYQYPGGPEDSSSVPAVVEPEVPVELYADGQCDHCGRLLPMNYLTRVEHEVQVGRSSGSTRTSRSNSYSFSGRSASNSSRYGTSSSSGRTFYKTETLYLCSDCYARHKQSTAGILTHLWRFALRVGSAMP